MPEYSPDNGCTVLDIDDAAGWSSTLEQQWQAIVASGTANRPWVFWELHNPWSRSAANVDSWALLDLCQSPAMIDCLAKYFDRDLILFDSQIVPNPALAEFDQRAWRSDDPFFPLDEGSGIVVRLPFGSGEPRTFEYGQQDTRTADYSIGQILVHDGRIEYRSSAINGSGNLEYLIRYFSAKRRFDRDPLNPKHVHLTDHYPWVNYARMPLWLVSGEDGADNDFVTGFSNRIGRWTTARSG